MIPKGIMRGMLSAWGASIKILAALFIVLFVISTIMASGNRTEGMRGSVGYLITETETTIDSLASAGEIEEVINCYRTILNALRVIDGQLNAVDILREYGPPE